MKLATNTVIDSDQHLVEYRGLWARAHRPGRPRRRDPRSSTTTLGNTWLTWRDERLGLADVQTPGETDAIGDRRHARARAASRPSALRRRAARATTGTRPRASSASTRWGSTRRCCSRTSACSGSAARRRSLPALLANMRAWNRWCATVVADGRGGCIRSRTSRCATSTGSTPSSPRSRRAGVRLAMIAPALVDGRPLSHPDLDRAWAAFVEHGITPVFHVADQPRVVRRRVVHRRRRSRRRRRSSRCSSTPPPRSRAPT